MASKREKFVQRSFRLVGETALKTLMALLPNLPLDDERPLQVLVREEPKVRGLDQNGLYWLRLGEVADQAWLNKRQYNSDCWHDYARRNLMPETITTKDGEVRSKWIEAPDGKLTVISTTQLERACFAEYTTIVEVFGAGLGVEFSANPREGAAA